MNIVYKKLTEDELGKIIGMRISQLTEEYTSEGRTVISCSSISIAE